MSPLDNFSVAANVLQVTGFADTVFRAGKSLYELFDKARSASRNITLLLFELQAPLPVVASVYIFAREYASSPFAYDDSHTLTSVYTILTLIDQDFRHVRGLLVQTVGFGPKTWLSLLQGSILWALKDDEIAASRQRLCQYTQNLTTALSVSGRRNDVVLRTKLQNIEDRLQAISQPSPRRPLDSEVYTRSPRKRPTFRVPRRQARAAYAITQHGSQSNPVRANYTSTDKLQKDRMIATESADFHRRRFPSISPTCPRINVSEEADQTLFLDVGNYALDQITKPRVLLRDLLVASPNPRYSCGSVGSSEAQAVRLKMLIDFLAASAHTASAETLMNRYGNNSEIKLLDRSFSGHTYKDSTARQQPMGSRSIAEGSTPTYLEKKSVTLDIRIGSIRGRRSFQRGLVRALQCWHSLSNILGTLS